MGPNLEGAPPEVRTSSLKFANYFYPRGDCWPGVRVVCLAGDCVRGQPLWGDGRSADSGSGSASGSEEDSSGSSRGGASSSAGGSSWDGHSAGAGAAEAAGGSPRLRLREQWGRLVRHLAFVDYRAACGDGCVVGDGVTPLATAQLPGAENLVLPGAWHAPQTRPAPGEMWYGDAGMVERWWHYLLVPGTAEAAAAAAQQGDTGAGLQLL